MPSAPLTSCGVSFRKKPCRCIKSAPAPGTIATPAQATPTITPRLFEFGSVSTGAFVVVRFVEGETLGLEDGIEVGLLVTFAVGLKLGVVVGEVDGA